MAKYIIQGETLKAIADEVRELTDITDEINPNEMIANMEQANADVAAQTDIIEQIKTALNGKAGSNAAEIGVIIDQSGVLDSTEGTVEEKVEAIIDLAKLKQLIQWVIDNYGGTVFQHWQISEKQIGLFDFTKTPSLSNTFRNNAVIENLFIDAPNAKRLDNMVNGCPKLKTIVLVDTSNISDWSNGFQGASNLVSIETLNFISATSWLTTVLSNLPNLEKIKIVPNTIPTNFNMAKSSKLSAESVQSIFDGLATVETAQTLTLHKDVKILQSQVDSANAKGWTVAGGTIVSEEEYYG